MKGWLIVNCFVNAQKFTEHYQLLMTAANKRHMELELKTTAQLMCSVQSNFTNCSLPDFIIFWDKDIYLAKRLEHTGIRLFNSAYAIETCDNKALTALCLEPHHIRMPKTFISPKTYENTGYHNLEFFRKVEAVLPYPMVIKEAHGSFGRQVYLVSSTEEAAQIISRIGYKDFIVQEFIRSSFGRDIRINVVGGKVIASMLRHNENDFRSNITNGGNPMAYTPSKAQCDLAVAACSVIGLDFAGVDVLFGENDEPLICEVNSNPHFKSTLDCTGINLADYIMEHIERQMQ